MASGSQVWSIYWADLAVAARMRRIVRSRVMLARLSKRLKAVSCRYGRKRSKLLMVVEPVRCRRRRRASPSAQSPMRLVRMAFKADLAASGRG